MVKAVLDEDELSKLARAHRAELVRHCYRMLGALGDAEDLVQETLMRAWQHRESFAGRASPRTWLFRIATNACLNALAQRTQRSLPEQRSPACELGEPIAARIVEPVWLEPFPGGTTDLAGSSERREQLALAFIAALQRLPPRQRAVLLLRDVVGWDTEETADLLETTLSAVESSLHRARQALAELGAEREHVNEPTAAQRDLLARYVSAWESGDVTRISALLREDAIFSMPPVPSWFQGRAAIEHFLRTDPRLADHFRQGLRLLPTSVNGGPGFGVYRGAGGGVFRPHSLMAVALGAADIARITTFVDPALVTRFGLPAER
jgi:RNA polymerase sigma-70 factor (ECF subfamily)